MKHPEVMSFPTLTAFLRRYLKGCKTLEQVRKFDNISLHLGNQRRKELNEHIKPVEVGNIVSFECEDKTYTGKVTDFYSSEGGLKYIVNVRGEYFDYNPFEMTIVDQKAKVVIKNGKGKKGKGKR